MTTTKATILERARLGQRLDGLFLFDAHQHLGEWHQFHMPKCEAADVIAVMDRIGIAQAATSGVPAAVGSDFRAGNDLVIAATRAYPGRLHGYIVVNPNDPAGVAPEIERCAAEGLAAVKIHSYHGKPYDCAEYRPAYEIANSRSWPVLAHTWAEELPAIDRLAAEYPNIRWLLAHAAAAEPQKYYDLARRRDSIFLDTCNSACTWNAVESLVKETGPEKILFGSDVSFLAATQQIGRVLFARISDRDKELILGLNARRFFRLD